jgi:ribosome-binding ATPase YchF (GTP1/OBG family)
MGLSVGIVGLPNAGKSTFFNALAARRLAETAPRPFTTIEAHEAVVALPDEKLEKLSTLVKPETTVPATVTFIDIAGLVKGASHGEGLGNQFLAKIREVNAIAHIVRAFNDPNVQCMQHIQGDHGKKEILEDIEIVNIELELGGIMGKPAIYILNVGEKDLTSPSMKQIAQAIKQKFGGEAVVIAAKMEEDLIDFEKKDRDEYLKESGVDLASLEKFIKEAYKLLGLITFYTIKGGKEVHAWSLKGGSKAIEAAAEVHTDFAKKFIKAEAINVDELLAEGGWQEAREKGKVRLEGKDYIVQDGDVVEFKIGA